MCFHVKSERQKNPEISTQWVLTLIFLLSRSEDPEGGTPLNLCLLGGALRIVLEAPAGIGDSVGVDEGLEGGGVVPVMGVMI